MFEVSSSMVNSSPPCILAEGISSCFYFAKFSFTSKLKGEEGR
ncbi:hypothetical protein SOVF_115160 [Spinacia oleracea]|nr:hypothetical protein SOVF_115160 [Spinacia oleracea]